MSALSMPLFTPSAKARRIAAIALAVACLAAGTLEADAPAAPAPGEAAPTFPLTAYSAFGSSLALSGHFGELGWNDAQMAAFLEGFRSATQGKAVPMDDTASKLAAEMGRRIGQIAASGQPAVAAADPKARLELYFKEMRKRLGLQISQDGLGYSVQTGRNGIRPRPGDTITFTAQASAADGSTKLPQLSVDHIRIKFAGMMPALMEGLQMMTVGSHAVFVIPPSLSFGEGQWPDGVQKGSPLVYLVSLDDVAGASAGASP
jgi:FKBP-type peptidyl-prolyl cis-trans isomerase